MKMTKARLEEIKNQRTSEGFSLGKHAPVAIDDLIAHAEATVEIEPEPTVMEQILGELETANENLVRIAQAIRMN